jgi:hypothetical protein
MVGIDENEIRTQIFDEAVGQSFDSALACDRCEGGCSDIPMSGFDDPSPR